MRTTSAGAQALFVNNKARKKLLGHSAIDLLVS